MITKAIFEGIANEIIANEFPDDHRYWALNKENLIDDIFRGTSPETLQNIDGDFHFLGELKTSLEIASEAVGIFSTLTTIYWFIKSKMEKNIVANSTLLKKKLIDAGLPAKKADKIEKVLADHLRSL